MAQTALPAGFRITDSNDDPFSGARLFFYDAGTLDHRTVYQDAALTIAHAQPVICDGGGLVPTIYVPTGLYRVIITNSDQSVTVDDQDDIDGPIDTSALTTTEAKPLTTVSFITTTTQLTGTAAGTVVNANPGGGNFTVTLPAASIGNGKRITLRNIGQTGTVTVSGGANDIDGESTRTLDRAFQTETYISDGSDWHVDDGVLVIKPITLELTDQATISWDMRDGNDAQVTLTDSRTLDAPDNPLVGQEGALTIIQDGFGDHTLTFNSIFKFSGGTTVQPSNGADERTIYRYKVRSLTEIFIWREWMENSNSIGFFREYDLGSVAINTVTTQPHGLGRYPAQSTIYLENVTPERGFVAGDRIPFYSHTGGTGTTGLSIVESTTNVSVNIAQVSVPVITADTRSRQALTLASWKLIIRVYE